MMTRLLPLLMVFVALPGAAREIAAPDLAALPPADVVILGEVHDNPVHHAHQAQAVAALRPRALVFEMLTPGQAARATPELRAGSDVLGAALGWDASGWPDFALYWPIFAAAPEARIFGAGMERETLRRLREEGAEAVFGSDAARFGLTDPLAPEDQAAREEGQQRAHCHALPPEALPGMVLGQRLRDAALARATAEALAETGGPVAVITGSGHARTDTGMVAPLRRALPHARILAIGQVEAEGAAAADLPFDLWIVTPAHPRDDPCEVRRN